VAIDYGEHNDPGESGSGYTPDPADAPFLVGTSSMSPVIDGLPIGAYGDISVCRVSDDLSLLASGGFSGDGWRAETSTGTGSPVHVHIAYLALRLVYEGGEVELPCDTWVDLDLSTATFMGTGDGGPFGEYGDGVIYGGGGGGFGYPDFYFNFELDPLKRYRVEITYDPTSAHDAGGRRFWLQGVVPGSEEDGESTIDFPIGGFWDAGPSGQFHDGSRENTADVVTVTIGPGINGWDDATYGAPQGYTRLWFETDTDGAVSSIRVRKVCKTVVPPLRQYPRADALGAGSARRVYPDPQTIQASNRRGPSAII
jgi:hypothetical protein